MYCRRSRRMPRETVRSTICVRKADGTLWCAFHDGQAEVMGAILSGGHTYSFRRVRPRRGHWVASGRIAWRFSDYRLFEVTRHKNVSVTMVG